MHQLYGLIMPLFNKIDLYITSDTVIEDRCTGTIKELCIIRDGMIICPLLQITKLCLNRCALIN